MENSTTRHVSDFYAGACRLRMKGFGLAQDDFGQGLSSVHNLVNTPSPRSRSTARWSAAAPVILPCT